MFVPALIILDLVVLNVIYCTLSAKPIENNPPYVCEESPDADIGELARKVADSEILNCFTKAGGLYFLLNPDFLFI